MNYFSARGFRQIANITGESLGSETVDLQNWISDRHDTQMEMLAAAIHEAGHVFAARAHGFEVAWVSLDPDFLTTNPLAIENECASGEPVSMVVASPRLGPILRRGYVISRKEWDTVGAYVLQCMAGPMAEASFNRHFQIQVAERDKLQANKLLWAVTRPSKLRFKQKLKQIFATAQSFVQKNRNSIFHLGVMIHDRRTIRRQDIDPAIKTARSLAAGGPAPGQAGPPFSSNRKPERDRNTAPAAL